MNLVIALLLGLLLGLWTPLLLLGTDLPRPADIAAVAVVAFLYGVFGFPLVLRALERRAAGAVD